jgi:hypothetical protein
MMMIGLLVWGMQAKIIYGGYCKRSYVSRPHLNRKMERETTKSCTVFKVGSRPNRQMKEFTVIVSLGCITRFRSILHLIPKMQLYRIIREG